MSTTHKSPVRFLAPLALTAAFGLLSTVPAFAQNYSLKLLGVLPTGLFSYGNAVNNSGQVAGQSNSGGNPPAGNQQATLYSGGVLTDINTNSGSANAINASGQVTGNIQTSGFTSTTTSVNQAYVYSTLNGVGTTTFLPSLGGNFSVGYGINNSGQVVGSSQDANGDTHAFLYSNFNLIDLDPAVSQFNNANFGGSGEINDTVASGINNNGRIVGTYFNNDAFTYDSKTGAVSFLPSLQHQDPADFNNFGVGSFGNAINDSGVVTGSSIASNNEMHAVIYSNGTVTDLTPNLSDNTTSEGLAINSHGDVVGDVTPGGVFVNPFAFIEHNGAVTDLNTLVTNPMGFDLFRANGISDNGLITGFGFTKGNPGHVEAFLLTPTASPEPSPLAALGLGLLGLGALAVKARRRPASAV